MADCSKCIHIDVCGKLMFFGRNCNKECIHYKDGSDLVEVVHGEWSTIEDDYLGLTALECSKCNQEYWFEEEPPIKIYNYCPNCGADMRGDGDA